MTVPVAIEQANERINNKELDFVLTSFCYCCIVFSLL